MTARIIVPGTRGFEDYGLMERMLDRLLPAYGDDIEIVSGHAPGADKLGEEYAARHGIPCRVFPADWERYGRKSGPRRNSQMIEYALGGNPAVIAFWDGSSRGTLDTLCKAMRKSIPVTVVMYDALGGYKLVRFSYEDGRGE